MCPPEMHDAQDLASSYQRFALTEHLRSTPLGADAAHSKCLEESIRDQDGNMATELVSPSRSLQQDFQDVIFDTVSNLLSAPSLGFCWFYRT